VTLRTRWIIFFKALESDTEENEVPVKKTVVVPPEKRTKDFYTILSDSEDETDNKKNESIEENSFDVPCDVVTNTLSQPSTSGFVSTLKFEVKSDQNNLKLHSSSKPDSALAHLDAFLDECSEFIDITEDEPKENVPVLR